MKYMTRAEVNIMIVFFKLQSKHTYLMLTPTPPSTTTFWAISTHMIIVPTLETSRQKYNVQEVYKNTKTTLTT